MPQKPRLINTGSLVLCGTHGTAGKVIAPFSRSKGERPTYCTHVGMMMTATHLIEARRRTVYTPLASYPETTDVVVVYPTFLTTEDRVALFNEAQKYKGKKYGYAKILAHAIDHTIFNDRYVTRRLCRLPNYPICSYLVGRVYHRALGYSFGVPYMQAQPDDIADYCRNHPEEWKIGYHNTRNAVRRYINGEVERFSYYDETECYQNRRAIPGGLW